MAKKVNQRRKFSKDFKIEAVRLSEMSGVDAAAQSVGVSPHLIYKWRSALRDEGPDAFRGNGNLPVFEEENRQLRRKVRELEEEAQILKKASAYFARHLR